MTAALRVRGWGADRRTVALVVAVIALLSIAALAAHDPLHGSVGAGHSVVPRRAGDAGGGAARLARGGGARLVLPGWLKLIAELLVVVVGVVVLGLLAGTGLLMVATRLRLVRHGVGEDGGSVDAEDAAREALREAIVRSLEEIRADPNARRAIIGAYRLMETTLARAGLRRAPAEAPREYLARALRRLSVAPAAPERLTALFERARFGAEELDLELRDEAVACLLALQEGL